MLDSICIIDILGLHHLSQDSDPHRNPKYQRSQDYWGVSQAHLQAWGWLHHLQHHFPVGKTALCLHIVRKQFKIISKSLSKLRRIGLAKQWLQHCQ